jgi:hypothetical protein
MKDPASCDAGLLRNRAKVVKGSRNSSKIPRIQGLLARTHEQPAVVGAPDVDGKTIVAAEPQAAPDVRDVEHARATARVSDRFHADEHPLVQGLILVLQTQLRTDFGRAELETELDRPLVDLATGGTIREAELRDRDVDEIEFEFDLLDRRPEGGLSEDVVRVVADLSARLLDGLAELISTRETRAELDGLPDREGLGDLLLDLLRGHECLTQDLSETVLVLDPGLAGGRLDVAREGTNHGRSKLSELIGIHRNLSSWHTPYALSLGLTYSSGDFPSFLTTLF